MMTSSTFTSLGSFAVAIIAAVVALRNRAKTDEHALAIQDLKGAIDRESERLRAKLAHGQVISSTQWSAEFAAYQAIWKGIVSVRPLADKLVNREEELTLLKLPERYLDNPARLQIRRELVQRLGAANVVLFNAIHDAAPFYPVLIRDAARQAQEVLAELLQGHLACISGALQQEKHGAREPFPDDNRLLAELFSRVDRVEELIRERLDAVQVVNSAIV